MLNYEYNTYYMLYEQCLKYLNALLLISYSYIKCWEFFQIIFHRLTYYYFELHCIIDGRMNLTGVNRIHQGTWCIVIIWSFFTSC